MIVAHVSEADRIRARTHPEVNARLDRHSLEMVRVAAAGSDEDLSEELRRVEREWDFERYVETEVPLTGLLGLALAVAVDRRFLLIPGVATAMMLLHAIHGWYPLLPFFRRLGIRSQDEIDRERFALKALRGDFAPLRTAESDRRAEAAWEAVRLDSDRVRASSPERANTEIDQDALRCLRTMQHADREHVSRHIDELEREWDIERVLQTNAGLLAFSGVLLGAAVSPKFLAVPGFVLSFLLQHGVQGWCPPIPMFRSMGIRTRKEINTEKYALKVLRGDFDQVPE